MLTVEEVSDVAHGLLVLHLRRVDAEEVGMFNSLRQDNLEYRFFNLRFWAGGKSI